MLKAESIQNRGVTSKLSLEDKILLLLMYYREYRTMFHIGIAYNISEAAVCKIIMNAETKLIHDKRFHLPGKKALTKPEHTFEVVWVDVAETPVERPKKTATVLLRQKEKAHYQITNSS
jgi:hypothetical protein